MTLRIPGKLKTCLFLMLLAAGAVFVLHSLVSTLSASCRGSLLKTSIIRPPGEVSALASQGNTLWAGGMEGVYAVDKKTAAVSKKLGGDVPFMFVKALLVDDRGVLWIGHREGLTRYDGDSYYTFDEKNGLPDRRVNALMQDRSGNLWVGTWGGAARFDGLKWTTVTRLDGLADDMVSVMLEDSSGGLWFGSNVPPGGGLSYYNGIEWQVFTARDVLPHNGICDLIEDSEGRIWVATGFHNRGGAASCLVRNRIPLDWQIVTRKDGLAGEKVRSIFQDRQGVYWFGSEYDGVARWDNYTWQIYTVNSGLSGQEVKDWLQDSEGNLWLATDSGVTKIYYEDVEWGENELP